MKPSTYMWIGIAIIAVGAGAYFLTAQNGGAPTAETDTTQRVAMPAIKWSFTQAPDKKNGDFEIPMTKVVLTFNGKEYPLGNYEGSCSEVGGQSWQPLQDEISGAVCYFAGGGKELGIFLENDKFILKEGIVEEGDAETPGTRANFKVIQTL